LTGDPCRQWITRPPVTWCKPAPTPGEIIDKFREATELIVWAAKQSRYYFDLDAVRLPPKPENERTTWNQNGPKAIAARAAGKDVSGHERYTKRTINPKGVPPLTWWVVNTSGYEGAHFATFPPELIVTPVICSCPPGGTILDPFAGSGTTLAVATGHGRNAIGIDLDARNAHLAQERVGMFLEVA
jgi:DNA modification methylase